MFNRTSGVLMPIFALPGRFGCGTFGSGARKFADFLKKCGFHAWQVLPLTPCDQYNSPYASLSAFAGNPYFIDLGVLCENGLLTNDELNQNSRGDIGAAYEWLGQTRLPLLRVAFSRVGGEIKKEVKKFVEKNEWVADYALFCALKDENGGIEWQKWDKGLRDRDEKALDLAKERLSDDVSFYEFLQYEFYRQWHELKKYVNSLGISIIGDMPIYLASDSADIWSNRSQYKLDSKGYASERAGVPPDYFAEEGQLWGNPLYDWAAMKKDGYSWWIRRMGAALDNFDAVRIDHFRAFSAYWSVPEGKSAKDGKWKKGPGMDLFNAIAEKYPSPAIIAEDLGDIDDDVRKLVKESGFPGMRVLQFGYISYGNNDHLPHNYPKNSIAYSGTHDNNTLLGYLWELNEGSRQYALRYVGFNGDWGQGGPHSESIHAFLRLLWQTNSDVVIIPFQDMGGYGADTRINTPGLASEKNWAFRISPNALDEIDAGFFLDMNGVYQRSNPLIGKEVTENY